MNRKGYITLIEIIIVISIISMLSAIIIPNIMKAKEQGITIREYMNQTQEERKLKEKQKEQDKERIPPTEFDQLYGK